MVGELRQSQLMHVSGIFYQIIMYDVCAMLLRYQKARATGNKLFDRRSHLQLTTYEEHALNFFTKLFHHPRILIFVVVRFENFCQINPTC